MAYIAPQPFPTAIRSGLVIRWKLDAWRGGRPVPGATDLQPISGNVEDDGTRPDRRKLTCELPPSPGLFGLLEPLGTTLKVTAIVEYPNKNTLTIPAGIYDIDTQNSGDVNGTVRLNAPDLWVKIKRARFIRPYISNPSLLVVEQIAELVRGAMGGGWPVRILSTSTAVTGAAVYERDRDKTITDLAKAIGAVVYFDRLGVFTIADGPKLGVRADWTVDAGVAGVMTSLDRERSRERTYNVVVVASSDSSGNTQFEPQIAWDNDPQSPTNAGPDPIGRPEAAGPFGVVPYFYESPLITSASQAYAAALTILATTTGVASSVNLGQLPNPAVDALDIIDAVPKKERYDIPRAVERHIVDRVSHPFAQGDEQQMSGRSTRTDDYS